MHSTHDNTSTQSQSKLGQGRGAASGLCRLVLGFTLGYSALFLGCRNEPDGPVLEEGRPDLQSAVLHDAGAARDAGHADGSQPDSGLSDGGQGDADVGGDLGSGLHRLRIMAANTTSGNKQSYDPGEGLRIFQGLRPDVALIQEFNYGDNSDTAVRGFIDTAFGTTYSYFRESGMQIPNGVASRYPILASGSWKDPAVSNRGFAWARIDIPGSQDLWAVSVHLLTSSSSNRDIEAKALVALIEKNVPSSDYLVIGGDLNSGTRTEPCLMTFSKIVSVAAPHPVDNLGNDNTSGPRSKPYDWVMPSPNLRMLKTGVVIGRQNFPNGIVVDSRVYTPLVDITPVLLGDSGASNMQHMAVVQDFMLP